MEKNAKVAKKYIWIGVFVFIFIIGLTLYGFGYRFTENFSIGKVGHLIITTSLIDTSIFVDQDRKIFTSKDNEVTLIELSPGKHQVIVSHERYFPWQKQFTMPSGSELKLSPILIAQNPSGLIVTEKDPEYWKIKNEISKQTLPIKSIPLVSPDLSTSLWIENNAIVISKENLTETIIEPTANIRQVDFYKDRGDAVIFSTSDTVYLIETDKKDTQNFFPIYKGTKPSFIKTDPNFIYVDDGSVLMQVSI